MRFIGWVTIYALSWLLFASFDFRGFDTIVSYSAQSYVKPADGRPKLLPGSYSVYRVNEDHVVMYTPGDGSTVRFNDCSIFNRKNWSCSDNDVLDFGFRRGRLFVDYPETLSSIYADRVEISGLRYHILGCLWDFQDDIASFQWAVCTVRPFLD